MAINICQRGIRIIDIDTFFAIPFSDLFRLKIISEILSIDLTFNITFMQRKRLSNERIRDHITRLKQMFFVSELSQAHLRAYDFISEFECNYALQKLFAECLAQLVRIYFSWSYN